MPEPSPHSEAMPPRRASYLTREQVLEHALRALVHAAPDDVVTGAMYLCTDQPGHSVLAGRAANEIERMRGADAEHLDFSAGLPEVPDA